MEATGIELKSDGQKCTLLATPDPLIVEVSQFLEFPDLRKLAQGCKRLNWLLSLKLQGAASSPALLRRQVFAAPSFISGVSPRDLHFLSCMPNLQRVDRWLPDAALK